MLAIAVVLGLGAAGLALRLKPTAATSTFVSSSSRSTGHAALLPAASAKSRSRCSSRDLQQLILGSDLERLLGLEGCLSGKVPAGALGDEGGANGPCGQLARAKTVKVVFGPGTFLNEAAEQIGKQLASESSHAEAEPGRLNAPCIARRSPAGCPPPKARKLGRQARKVALAGFRSSLVTQALEYGLTAVPSIEDVNSTQVVFDSTKPAGTPKSRFAYLFPSRDAALVSVRMKAGLSESQGNRTIG